MQKAKLTIEIIDDPNKALTLYKKVMGFVKKTEMRMVNTNDNICITGDFQAILVISRTCSFLARNFLFQTD